MELAGSAFRAAARASQRAQFKKQSPSRFTPVLNIVRPCVPGTEAEITIIILFNYFSLNTFYSKAEKHTDFGTIAEKWTLWTAHLFSPVFARTATPLPRRQSAITREGL